MTWLAWWEWELDPVMGTLLLADLDATLAQHGVLVVRFMDAILVLTPTRWTLRAAVRLGQQGLAALGWRPHPDQTCIGKIARGLTLLGDHLRPQGLTVARQTVERFVARARQLYEQQPGGAEAAARLGAYGQRWGSGSGLGCRGEGSSQGCDGCWTGWRAGRWAAGSIPWD